MSLIVIGLKNYCYHISTNSLAKLSSNSLFLDSLFLDIVSSNSVTNHTCDKQIVICGH